MKPMKIVAAEAFGCSVFGDRFSGSPTEQRTPSTEHRLFEREEPDEDR